jgi:hypothetical protein
MASCSFSNAPAIFTCHALSLNILVSPNPNHRPTVKEALTSHGHLSKNAQIKFFNFSKFGFGHLKDAPNKAR